MDKQTEKSSKLTDAREVRNWNCDLQRALDNESETKSRKIYGYAFLWNKWSNPIGGWFREKINPGALEGADMSDVVAVLNHNYDLVLARTPDTLKLTVDEIGLRFEFEALDTTAGDDLLKNVESKIIRNASFSFEVEEEEWIWAEKQGELDERTIIKFRKIWDISPVVFPAYPDTTTSLRMKESYLSKKAESGEMQNEMSRNLLIIKQKQVKF